MVNPSMLCSICLWMVALDIASLMHMRAPFHISSIAKGQLVRPGLYTLLEDVVSVDMGGSKPFREKFNERWLSSPAFRNRMYHLSVMRI